MRTDLDFWLVRGSAVFLALTGLLVLRWIFGALQRWLSGGSTPAEMPADPQADFAAAKALLSKPRIDAETGDGYAYKLVRVPADLPQSEKPATIIDPIQRKRWPT